MSRRPYKRIQIALRRGLVRVVAAFGRRSGGRRDTDFNRCRVLFLCQNRIGDTLVSTPVFHQLKQHYPGIRLDVVLSRRNQEVLQYHPLIEQRYVLKQKPLDIFPILRRIRGVRYDYIVDFTVSQSSTSTLLCLLSRAGCTVGLERNNDFVYHLKYPNLMQQNAGNPQPRMVKSFAQVLRAFQLDPDRLPLQTQYFGTPSAEEFADKNIGRLAAAAKQSGACILGINIAASKREKFWGLGRYVDLVKHLSRWNPPPAVMILWSREYRAEAEQMAAATAASLSLPTGSLADFAASIARLDYLISPDSAAVHLADTSGVPVLVLTYEPADNTLWHPCQSPYRIVNGRNGSLQAIGVNEVVDSFRELASRGRGVF